MKKIVYAGAFILFTGIMVSCTSDNDSIETKSKTSKEVLTVKEGPGDEPIIVPPPKK
ncbi:hypothetical protein ACFFLS_23935 [Flavobacterium procerum]|uniref:Cytochrome C551 n=1 Tax=Flavobacterium procerum TaxID=1455569 RepID=A0ABV6BXC8_9FLAO